MVNLSEFTSKKKKKIEWSRPVHKSIWVEFVPNLESTKPDWMVRISTRCRSEWLIISDGSDLRRMAVGSIEVGDLKIGQNPVS